MFIPFPSSKWTTFMFLQICQFIFTDSFSSSLFTDKIYANFAVPDFVVIGICVFYSVFIRQFIVNISLSKCAYRQQYVNLIFKF